jgi:transcription elongation GreA/GreB family factor/very-short-patch-repair endonuclease
LSAPRQEVPNPRGRTGLRAALEQLRLKLLDLTGRNRLLNFKHSPGRSLQSVEGSFQAIYDHLVEGNASVSIAVRGIPEPHNSDWPIQDGRRVRPEPAAWASLLKIPTSFDLPQARDKGGTVAFRALLYPDDLAKHCRKIEREANLAIEETGANMLFLVLGFLDYPDEQQSDRHFLAPLISIPVRLTSINEGGQKTFSIECTGDELAANLSLHEKIRVDHGLVLPDFNEEERDVEKYFEAVIRITRTKPGFELKRRISLCLLSFTNMLLVRDLTPENWRGSDNSNGLLDHDIVKQLFEGQRDADGGGQLEPPSYAIDDEPHAAIPLVFDADSSQQSALIDVIKQERPLVIEGPPGTGKSQTITNLIALCIAAGKTVLFVAEKLAALEVVKSRLTLAGLDPFVLELHSSKTSKKRVLEELGRRIDFRPPRPPDLPRKVEQLSSYRAQLRAYINVLKSVTNNSIGLTVHALMWRTETYRLRITSPDIIRSPPNVSDASELTPLAFTRRMDAAQHLGGQFVAIGGFNAESPFWGFYPEKLLPGDEHFLQRVFVAAAGWAQALIFDATALAALRGEKHPFGLSVDSATEQLGTLDQLRSAAPINDPLYLVPRLFGADPTGAKIKQHIERLGARLTAYRGLERITRAGLKQDELASADKLVALKRIDTLIRDLGGTPGTVGELLGVGHKLRATAAALQQGLAVVHESCKTKALPVAQSRAALSRLQGLVQHATRLPEADWKHFNAALAEEGASDALDGLSRLQSDWQALHAKLEGRLYLDTLPEKESLHKAILLLREGDAWYRIFQSKWRAASTMHRRLLRAKTMTSAEARLPDLEAIENYSRCKERWQKDPGWEKYYKQSPGEEAVPLDGHRAIAQWHDATCSALVDLGLESSWLPRLSPEQAKRFRRDYVELNSLLNELQTHLAAVCTLLPRLETSAEGQSLDTVHRRTLETADAVLTEQSWLSESCPADANFALCLAACEAALDRAAIVDEIGKASPLQQLLGNQYRGLSTDVAGILRLIGWGQRVQASTLPTATRRLLLGQDGLAKAETLSVHLTGGRKGLAQAAALEQQLQKYGACDLSVWCRITSTDDLVGFSQSLQAKLATAAERTGELVEWSRYVVRRGEALTEGLGDFVRLLEEGRAVPAEVPAVCGYATFASMVKRVFEHHPELARFSGLKHSQICAGFRKLDKEIIEARGAAIASEAARGQPAPAGRTGVRVDDKSEMALLNHLIPQQRPRVPVRQILARAPASVQRLKPCLMMGPHAVAQFLKPGSMQFDIVVMDEASQLRPEEAVGAAARGRQLVVVGDPKQLPPTNCFSRQNLLGEDVEQFITTDAESILDICLASFRPSRSLRWHYRSQHHSLIAFSNHSFYEGRLVICPSPYGQSHRLGVRATYLANAVYDNQTNLLEAKRVVDAVAEHVATRREESLGVVTLNIKQRDLISELLEERLARVATADDYRQRWSNAQQGLFVKNLENVQGDERDCIIISTTFGRPPGATVVRQNFGPISRQGGWRRLNVLFTRARKSVSVITSLRPEDILIDGSTPDGTKALRNYLEYARSGTLQTSPVATDLPPDSDFETSVIEVLRGMNYEVTPQLGVSGFRIDIAVKHPQHAGVYLAAIECDGAQYHSAQSARDRDRIRQEILESQGWKGRIWRIWSTDWFRSPYQEIEKLKSFLDRLQHTWKPEHAAGSSWVEEGTPPSAESAVPTDEETQTQRQIVDEHLLDAAGMKEVRIGDTIEYIDTARADDVKTVRITKKTTALDQGLIAETTPLAQALLGGVVGDEVFLNLPGIPKKTLRIISIKRPD